MFLLIQFAHRGFLLGDSKSVNWGFDTDNDRLVMLDLGGVEYKPRFKNRQIRGYMEHAVFSFERSPNTMKHWAMAWFDEKTEAAGDRLPSLDAASEIANGLPMQAEWQSSPAKIAASMDALDEDFANYDNLPSVAQACTVLVDHILAGIHGLRFSLRICLCSLIC